MNELGTETGLQEPAADDDLMIVGVGASAGGIEALQELLQHISFESAAFVVVQHLSAQHDSQLPEILAKSSPAEVVRITDGTRVLPRRLYVIPPNYDLAILDGVLHLLDPGERNSSRLPIDSFFRSLAQDRRSRACGVILSGTGTDGTLGLRAIKEHGGLTFVQDPATARHDGMPQSAIQNGHADYVGSPQSIAQELIAIARHPYLTARLTRPVRHNQDVIAKIILLIRAALGNDLTYYKPSTIERRIERRMALHKLERIEDYLKMLYGSPAEVSLLHKDILISVTRLFRDEQAFDALKTTVFPQMMQNKPPGATIRIWSPACSTGEEPYSILISLLEYLGDRAGDYRIQIFGTDIDDGVIQSARHALYPQNAAVDMSPERVSRFFVRKGDELQIARRVRDLVVFSVHDVTRDPPFSRLDLVACRNLLIYLQPLMQKKVLRILHYALNPNGYLMLGTSESVGELADLFSLVDRANKLYVAKHVPTTRPHEVSFAVRQPEVLPPVPVRAKPSVGIASIAERKILDMYGPPGVVVNDKLDVLHFRGRTSPYLEPAPGAASLNILRLARAEIHVELRRSLQKALSGGTSVMSDCQLKDGAGSRPIRLEVVPIPEPETKALCFLVLFHENVPSPSPARPHEPVSPRVEELERELLLHKEYLESTVEALESANEELQAANEELQSSNEELQSTNEELETSKEELQSANEELTTVNDDLQMRIADQQQANDDLYSLLACIDEPAILVGIDGRIRRYSAAAARLCNLVPNDIGRSINQINSFIPGQKLEALAARVVETLKSVEVDVLCANHRWYHLRISPHKTLDHAIGGVLVFLSDVDAKKRGEAPVLAEYLHSLFHSVPRPLIVVNDKNRAVWVSEAVQRAIGVHEGDLLADLTPMVDRALAGGYLKVNEVHFKDRLVRVTASRLPGALADSPLVLFDLE